MRTWHMARRDDCRSSEDMLFLVVKKDVRSYGPQDGRFIAAADKMRLIGRCAPGPECAYNAFMRGRIPRCDKRNTNLAHVFLV